MSNALPLSTDDLGDLLTLDPDLPVLDRLLSTHETLLSHPCTGSFESQVHRALDIKSASTDGTIRIELQIEPQFCSDRKAMHGSCGACIIDLSTIASLCCLARPGFWAIPAPGHGGRKGWFAGVTRNLGITWVAPARLGEVLDIRCVVVSVTARSAVVRCEARIKNGASDGTQGRLVFFGWHELVSVVRALGKESAKL